MNINAKTQQTPIRRELLNSSISEKNISKNVNKLKNGKSPGLDQISNEIIKTSFPLMTKAFLRLFNLILDSEYVPENWCKGVISPSVSDS